VSPQGGRQASSKGGGGNASGPAAARRLGLLVFGVSFVVLFAIVAIAEGIGDPSVPSGDVALVEDVPGDIGNVTKADLDHAILLAAKQGGMKKAPKPGGAKYDELKESAMQSVLEGIWIQGVADEWGVEVTDAEVAKELQKVKKESFPTEAEFQKFLNESGYTSEDIDLRIRIQMLSTELQEELKEKAPTPTEAEIEDYYEAAKATQFTQKPSRDVRLIVNKDRKKAKDARNALSGDNSAGNWAKVAKKYSEDPSTKGSGGLQNGVEEGTLEEPLEAAVFGTPEGRVEGPLETERGYTVFEVVNSTPESVQDLKSVESQIESTLKQRNEQEYFTAFIAEFNAQWTQRTFCDPDYTTSRCANFEDDGRLETAPEGCYEEDPKGGFPEACPAPVYQLIPALPGTVTPLEPKGKPLPQRPQPAGGAAAGAEGAELPEGAAPPPAEAPSE
jgi:parvulin-like peptidyl-prolyl isomerase